MHWHSIFVRFQKFILSRRGTEASKQLEKEKQRKNKQTKHRNPKAFSPTAYLSKGIE